MLEEGIIIDTQAMRLKVEEMRGNWIKFRFWNEHKKQWQMRGYAEKREEVESKIKSGEWVVQNA